MVSGILKPVIGTGSPTLDPIDGFLISKSHWLLELNYRLIRREINAFGICNTGLLA